MIAGVTTPPTTDPEHSGIGPALNGVGAVVVAFWLIVGQLHDEHAALVLVISLLALLAWVVRSFSSRTVVRDLSAVIMLVAGAAMVTSTDSLLITPAIVAVAGVTSDVRKPVRFGVLFAVAGSVIALTSVVVTDGGASFGLSVLAGFAIGFVAGLNRRQTRESLRRDRELAYRTAQIETEKERSALLADRATIARDIHDVLAHSLGGLVIQLDAVEALIEKGRIDEAGARVAAARTLAAEGLGEARRAVATLRDPDQQRADDADSLAQPDAIDRLVAAHESLGGTATVAGRSALDHLDPSHRRVLAAVVREALSNARRHAPGERVSLAFSIDESKILHARIANAAPLAATSSGGGHGVPGMTERLAALDDGSSLTAGRQGDLFVVDARVVTS
ncbi:MAG: hypothetical protein JWP75_2963 [Frondihabitans sp.]|nr:hypothetical protein [Frondihabitans sp.]